MKDFPNKKQKTSIQYVYPRPIIRKGLGRSKGLFNKTLEIKLLRGTYNIGVTSDGKYLIGDTNDFKKWDTIKIPLPKRWFGKWNIARKEADGTVILN